MALFLLYIHIDLRIHQVQNLSCIYGLLFFILNMSGMHHLDGHTI
jgi:hypothetical protein